MRSRKRIRLTPALLLAIVATFAGSAAAAPTHGTSTVTIRHEVRGCHTWSYHGGPYKASLAINVVRGTTLTFVNNDVMPHRIVRTSGPSARLITPAMNHVSATARVRLAKAGVYRFTTRAGEDYKWAGNPKTMGEDNVLRLTVTVR